MSFFAAFLAATFLLPQAYRSSFFAEAASAPPDVYGSLPSNIWLQRFINTLHTFALPFVYYFRPFCTALALFWLVYRATRVLYKPLDELSSLLGFDIPSAPLIDLASIKADGAMVHWSHAEKLKQKGSLKYAIHLNGVVIGNVTTQETAVTITGLQPDCFYVARVALVNGHDFSSKSAPIRFRTKLASSGDCFNGTTLDGTDTELDAVQESAPKLRLYRGLKNITPASTVSAPMTRSGSSGLDPRRSSNGRRLSPGVLVLDNKHDPQPDDNEAPEGTETIQQLTKKLDAIRRETEEADRQTKEEEEEELRLKEELLKERDELRAELNEREKASRNLKKEVNIAERQNTAAQNERLKLERALQQKKGERQKFKDDVVRWDREAEEMETDVRRLREEKSKHLEQATEQKEALRTRLAEISDSVRELDDQVKEKTSEVKRLERAQKEGSPSGADAEPNLVQQFQQDAEDTQNHLSIMATLQQRYAILYQRVDDAKRFHAEQLRFLESLRAERRRQDELQAQYASPPPTQDRPPRRENSQRSRNAASRLSVSDSPRLAAFPINSGPFAGHANALSSGFGGAPFLNIQNGMTISNPTDAVAMSEEDRNQMTGGAGMSPGIEELLPRGLLSGDDKNTSEHVQPLPGLGSLPGLPGRMGPLPQPFAQNSPTADPASPVSASSRSPSFFASPRASQNNLNLGSPGEMMDADRRSLRSTRSTRATSGGTTSRFTSIFGRQKNQTVSEEGPPLSKASSMPRADQMISGLSSAARKRNSSISGTVFQGPNLDGSADAPTAVPLSRRAFGLFSREKSGGWPTNFATQFSRRPTSPRPGSTHSTELPRPSTDSTRWGVGMDPSWASGDGASGARNSPLSFGPGWALPPSQQARFHGSRHPSRRPSVQYGASGPPEDIMEDDDSDALDADQASHLAPIGTKRPAGSKKAADTAAKLNPNAKDFKSFFGMKFRSGKDKSEDRSASRDGSELSTTMPSASTTPNPEEEESPPNSRKSRDVHSLTTTESTVESDRPSSDLARTPSYSNSDMPSPSLAGSSKETFMQKITRKSSSGKFTLPTFKREKSNLNPSSAASATATYSAPFIPAEQGEEDDMDASVGSLKEASQMGSAKSSSEPRESKDGNRSSRSWSSVLKIGKKKGNETPSVSDMSMGTEEADEEDEEEDILA